MFHECCNTLNLELFYLASWSRKLLLGLSICLNSRILTSHFQCFTTSSIRLTWRFVFAFGGSFWLETGSFTAASSSQIVALWQPGGCNRKPPAAPAVGWPGQPAVAAWGTAAYGSYARVSEYTLACARESAGCAT